MNVRAFYCVGTHWDREWYEPFQEYRMWLVELIDELIDLMESDPDYKCFHLDGQAVVLEDYLAVRPERRDTLVRLLKEGRLIAGPWYVLPDEWLISAESYVRNIMTGMRKCRELGVEPLKFAYTPDQFGHIAALPTIMSGFGLLAGICWRGTQDENFPAQFVWVGPDGSKMVTHKLIDRGSYGPFDFLARTPIKQAGFSDESFREHFEPYFEAEKERAKVPLVLMLDAIDHQRPDPDMPHLFSELTRRYPDIQFIWGSLADYALELLGHVGELPEHTGELRQPCRASDRVGQYLIVHVISSRYPIKKRNDQCQALLEKWAEPYALFHQLAGGEPIVRYLDLAWEYLLKNHPHDSICGCSIDQVHRDMMYRFDQCEMIAEGLVRRVIGDTASPSESDEDLPNVIVHNPLPVRRTGVFEIPVMFPHHWPKTFVDGLSSAERINKFVLTGVDGESLPFQLSAIERGVVQKRLRTNGRNSTHGGDVYHLAVEMTLPPGGFTGFTVEPTDNATRNFGSLMTGPMQACNGPIELTVHSDGTVSLSHRASGRVYSDLFLYEDCGDSGDGWTFGKLVNDIVYRGPGTRVTTAIDEDGPLRTVFRIEREFDLPAMMDRRTGWRSEKRVAMRVTDRIYLVKDRDVIRVRTHIENTCMDHRFRVLFPTDNDSKSSFAETPFAVVNRAIDIPADTKDWQERVNPEKAFTTFFGIKDNEGGFAVLAPFGLHEYEVLQTPEHTLALTLFRSTYKTVGTDGQPDGELQGDLDFEYMLYPFAGGFDASQAAYRVTEEQAGIRVHASNKAPYERSFVKLLKNTVVATAIKPAADGHGGIVRLWNPEPISEGDAIQLERPVKKAAICNLAERPIGEIELNSDGSIPVTVPPCGIVTVRFVW
ncbi:MAG: hypothetical protein QG656_2290 [Candidatus Hydrogenedentes bacterium]|nr:hypothetical protein [Candidatus Hydrogenedentota bacterium]